MVFDTGSSWLNIKACLNNGHCHKHSYEDKPEAKWPNHLAKYRKKILKDKFNKNGVVYYMNKSTSGRFTNQANDFALGYGSANLQGGRNQDYVCLKPLPKTVKSVSELSPKIM